MKKLALVFWVAQILAIIFSWRSLPPQVPLFYSRPWGEEQLATPASLFILPGLSLIIFLINSALSLFLDEEEKLGRSLLTGTAMLFSLLCLITLIKIIRLVI